MENAEFRAIEVDYTGQVIENRDHKKRTDITPKALKKIIEKGEVPTVEIPVVYEKELSKEDNKEFRE